MRRSKSGLFTESPKVYASLLNYPCVTDWIEGYDSQGTRDVYLRTIHVFLEYSDLTPDQLLIMKPKEVKDKLVAFTRSLRDQGKLGWASNVIKSVKSFYRHHGQELKLQRTERIRAVRKRVNFEIVPNKHQVYKMADCAGNLRDRAIVLCMWQSGVRVGCLTGWKCSLVKDQIFPSDGAKMKIPIHLKITEAVETKLSSYGLGYYYTFLGLEAAEALRDYLQWRIKNGEKLLSDTQLFVSHATTIRGTAVRPGSIRDIVKRCARDAGLDPQGVWPHCLRKAFRKVLNNSDIDEDTREALMGHKLPGSRGSYFDSHDVDEIAEKYMRCDFSRSEAVPEDVKKEMLLTLWRDQAKMFDIDPMKIRIEKRKELGRDLNTEEEIATIQSAIKKLRENSDPQKIVSERELENHLAEGWEFVSVLPSQKILIRKS